MGNIFDIIDFLHDIRQPYRRREEQERQADPSELRVRSQMAADEEAALVEAARMAAFEKQGGKCARCDGGIRETAASLRLVSSERGLRPDNVILLCEPCGKAMDGR